MTHRVKMFSSMDYHGYEGMLEKVNEFIKDKNVKDISFHQAGYSKVFIWYEIDDT